MPRIVPQDLVSPELTQVQATPVSTLTAPGITPPPATNSFLQLANALQGVQPSLNRFLDNRMVESTEEDIQKGKEAQLKNKMAFKDAVKSGAVPAGANPWFVQGYQEQEQRLNGLAFDQSMREAWTTSPVRNSDDPQAFKSWMQEYTSKYVEDNKLGGSPMFTVFQQSATAAQHNLASEHISYRQNDIEAKTIAGAQTLINNVLDYPMIYNGANGQIDAVKSIVNQHVANGMNPTIANRLVVDSITQKAEANLSISDLKMIDDIDFGNGSLGKTQYAREQIDLAERRISERSHTKASSDRMMEKQNAAVVGEDLQRGYLEELRTNPAASPDKYIAAGIKARMDPDEIKKFYGFKEAALTDQKSIYEDPLSTGALSWKSMNGQTDYTEISAALVSRQITRASADKMFENLKDERNGILRNDLIRMKIDGVFRQMVVNDQADTATVEKANAVKFALATDAVAMAAKGDSVGVIGNYLTKASHDYINAFAGTDEDNKPMDVQQPKDRKTITNLEAKTKSNLVPPVKEPQAAPQPVAPKMTSKIVDAKSFAEASKEYNESQGTKGTFVEEAKAAGVPVAEYIKKFTTKKK